MLNDSRLRAGFVAGGGFEWQLGTLRPIQFAVLQRFVLQGRSTLLRSGTQQSRQLVQQNRAGILNTNTGIHTTWRNNGVIARAGINYHIHWFDAAPIAPVVARY